MNGRQFPLYCTANDTLRNRRDLDIIFSKSRPLLLLGLPLHLGKSGCGLLDVRGEVRELLHLSNFNYLILRTGASLCSEPGHRFAHSIASSFDFTWIIQ